MVMKTTFIGALAGGVAAKQTADRIASSRKTQHRTGRFTPEIISQGIYEKTGGRRSYVSLICYASVYNPHILLVFTVLARRYSSGEKTSAARYFSHHH